MLSPPGTPAGPDDTSNGAATSTQPIPSTPPTRKERTSTNNTSSGSTNTGGVAPAISSTGWQNLSKKQQRELAGCRTILDELEGHDEAWPFLVPVNTKQFPTYKKIIRSPMDLSTIRKRLLDGQLVYFFYYLFLNKGFAIHLHLNNIQNQVV